MIQLFKSKTQNKQLLCNYGVFIINGMLALSIGSLLPYIRDSRGLEYAFCGMILSLHSVGNLISGFISGALPAVLGRKKSILLFNAFFALSYLVIIFSDNNYLLALAFFLTGMARGATSNFCNQSINELAPGKASFLNGLHAMFAIGAFVFPLLLLALTSVDASNWIYACYFMLAMGILSWILYFIVPVSSDTVKKETKTTTAGFAFFKEPLFYLCTLTLFFYLCAEQGVIGWMITYFKDTGLLPASLSQVTASVLWIMILAGRYVHSTDPCRYHGLWVQHGRTVSDHSILCRNHYPKIFSGMELHFDDCQFRIDPDAFDHRKNCRNRRNLLRYAVYYRGRCH